MNKVKANTWIREKWAVTLAYEWVYIIHTYYKWQENISAFTHIAIFGFADPSIVSIRYHKEKWLGLLS